MGGRRTRSAVSWGALFVAALASLATRPPGYQEPDWRYPCDFSTGHEPNAPLFVFWAYEDDLSALALRESIWMEDASGTEVPLIWSDRGDGLAVLCPQGGLEPHSSYGWFLDALGRSYNHDPVPHHDDGGWYRLETGPPDGRPTVDSQAACDALELPETIALSVSEGCDPCAPLDTGRWSDGCPPPQDTAPPDDTGDSGDSADPSDTGDTGDTDDRGQP